VNLRISDERHEQALQRAHREGNTVSELAREAIEDHVK
jgi:predicted HicB family RNase H-like nuclease